jgi:hypothetical protein
VPYYREPWKRLQGGLELLDPIMVACLLLAAFWPDIMSGAPRVLVHAAPGPLSSEPSGPAIVTASSAAFTTMATSMAFFVAAQATAA